MKLSEIARVVGASEPNPADVEVTSLAYDLSRVEEGSLFFCIKGQRRDGHEFARNAQSQGAVGLVCETAVDVEIPVLSVANSRKALNAVSSGFFGNPSESLRVFGVTGTNGKTTTAFMMDSIFRAAGDLSGLIGTIETRIGKDVIPGTFAGLGTPESCDLQFLLARMRDAGVVSVALEATSIGLDQGRLDGTIFDVVAFTNLTRDHIEEYHGTFEHYYQAKRKLFDRSRARAGVINLDDEWGVRLMGECDLPAIGFGLGDDAEVRAVNIAFHASGVSFTAAGPGFELPVEIMLPGAVNVSNALCAISASHLMSIDGDAVVHGLKDLTGVPGRFESIRCGQGFSVIVDYAHTPDSLGGILRAARDMTKGRVLVVFGCGGDRDHSKRALMGEVAANIADFVIATSDNPRSEDPEEILKDVELGIMPSPPPGGYSVVVDREQAITDALGQAAQGDVVVIAGKGHETGQEFATYKVEFDDRIVARRLLKRMGYNS